MDGSTKNAENTGKNTPKNAPKNTKETIMKTRKTTHECPVCQRPDRPSIDAALDAFRPYMDIKEEFPGVTAKELLLHQQHGPADELADPTPIPTPTPDSIPQTADELLEAELAQIPARQKAALVAGDTEEWLRLQAREQQIPVQIRARKVDELKQKIQRERDTLAQLEEDAHTLSVERERAETAYKQAQEHFRQTRARQTDNLSRRLEVSTRVGMYEGELERVLSGTKVLSAHIPATPPTRHFTRS